MAFEGNIWWGGIAGIIVVFGPAYIVYGIISLVARIAARSRGHDSPQSADAEVRAHEEAAAAA